jgi:hypothetical protein
MRVALLGPPDGKLAHALAAAGHTGAVLSPAGHPAVAGPLASGPPLETAGFDTVRMRRLPDAPLRLRKIGDDLAVLPAALRALTTGGFDAAHAFAPELACAAAVWSRRSGRPAVFTPTVPPRRETLAARRLRLAAWRRALAGCAVAAPTDEVRDALRRWLAVDAPVVAPGDAAGHVALYAGAAQV